jgi:hypothetical protein
MDLRPIPWMLTALLIVAMSAAGGCSDADDTGPYVEAKNDWDSPPARETVQDMRTRLSTTQQDH